MKVCKFERYLIKKLKILLHNHEPSIILALPLSVDVEICYFSTPPAFIPSIVTVNVTPSFTVKLNVGVLSIFAIQEEFEPDRVGTRESDVVCFFFFHVDC